jgi:hypothetical protein
MGMKMPEKPTYGWLAILLDACLEAVEEAAAREAKRKPINGILYPITWQTRLTKVREAVNAALDLSTDDFPPHPATGALDPAFRALSQGEISVARMHEIVSLWLSGQPFTLPDDAA